jgi:hypothetical protein
MSAPQLKHGSTTPLLTPGGLPAINSDCCCASTTCTCPSPPPATVTVSGVAGIAGGCSCPLPCDSDSTDPNWDGTLYNANGVDCVWWAADTNFDPLSLNGLMLDIAYTQLLLRTSVTPCRWELYIACGSNTNPTCTMWYGYKYGGGYAGTYGFVGSDCGLTGPATLSVT